MKNFLITIGVIVGLVAFTFAANEFEIFGIRFWGVRSENARTEVYHQSQSYTDGKALELNKYELEYKESKDPQEKEAIRQTIIHTMAAVDKSTLPDDERIFLYQLENR
jgi:hypothetical protein